MGIERRNPVPPGRYWIDIFESGFSAWQTWLASNRSTVRVESTEEHPAAGDAPARQFFIFSVSAPILWPENRGLGLPSIADPGVSSSADTVVRPPPPGGVIDQLGDAVDSISSGVKTVVVVVGGLAIAIAALAVVARLRKR